MNKPYLTSRAYKNYESLQTAGTLEALITNASNISFYEALGPLELQRFAQTIDLEKCPDLDQLKNYIDHSTHVLEIGAGYGRVIQGLRERRPELKITAVELAKNSVTHLQKRFQNTPNLRILSGDILEVPTRQEYDLALWLWSGLADLNRLEQRLCVKRLATLLFPSGALAIDLPADVTNMNATTSIENYYKLRLDPKLLYYGYIPPKDELIALCSKASLIHVQEVCYSTSTGKQRLLEVFKKA
ncbi:MAG: class I SAM-dependent methyltransferase [Bdellovibrionota bacterium]